MAAKKGHTGKVRAGDVQGRKKLTVVVSCHTQKHTNVIKGLKLTRASRAPEKEVILRPEVPLGWWVSSQSFAFPGEGGQETLQAALLSLHHILLNCLKSPPLHRAKVLSVIKPTNTDQTYLTP